MRFLHEISAGVIISLASLLSMAGGQSSEVAPSSGALVERGKALIDEGRLAESEITLEQAHSLSPSNVEVLGLLGKVKASLGESEQAIELLRKAVTLSPASAERHVDLAIALSDAREFTDALQETSEALSIDPKSQIAHLTRARNLADLQRTDDARLEFAAARRLAPDDPNVLLYWAVLERDTQNFSAETSLLEKLVDLQPENTKALLLLGHSFLNQSKSADAVAPLRRVLAIDPNSAEATYMLSRALSTTRPAESKDLQRRFAELKSKEANLDRVRNLGNEGYAAFAKQDWADAIRLFEEALAGCGTCEMEATLYKNLGLALCRSGDIEEGKKQLRRALSIDPSNRDAAKALSVVAP